MGELANQNARIKFGQALKIVRLKKNLSQLQVAELSDITVTYYAQIERGEVNPSLDILHRIAKTLRVKLSAILPF